MRIGMVTGTRADYGLLRPLAQAIRDEPGWELGLFVTAAHLDPAFGSTVRQIESDGLPIVARIESLDADDTGLGTARAVARGVTGVATSLVAWRPDLLVLVGDRFEQLAAAEAGLFLGIPMAHLYGGDLTEGAFDDAIRHAVTKMAHLHFVSNEPARRRVIQMGEQPGRVHLVGSPALDGMLGADRLDRDTLAAELEMPLAGPIALVTFHPATLDEDPAIDQLDEVLEGVAAADPPLTVVITRSNADPQGRALNARIDEWLTRQPSWRAFDALGPLRYHSLLENAAVVVGNSSSGLYEAPSFGVPAVNVGDRQRGRVRAASVIDVPARRDMVASAIAKAMAGDYRGTANPYGDGRTVPRIMAILRELGDPRALLRKHFHDMAVGG